MKRSNIIRLRWLRRISQIFFLGLFFWFLLRTTYSSRSIDLTDVELVTTAPVNNFFKFDPLITIGHIISTHSIYPGLAFSLITLLVTLILGRIFCGWICPFGSLHHFCSYLKRHSGSSSKIRIRQGRYRPLQNLKYYILFFLLLTAAFAYFQVGILDPLCLLTRSFIFSVFPAINFLAKNILEAGMDSPLNFISLRAERIYDALWAGEYIGADIYYDWSILTGAIFLALLTANLLYNRFWCRFLCPLGALFALFSRFSIVRIGKATERCTRCGKCMALCQGGSLSLPRGKLKWREPECLLCLNCQAVCPEDVMSFELLGLRDSAEYSTDMTRRGLITSIGAGIIAIPILGLLRREANYPRLIRPPGALPEKRFLATCLRCGSCTRVCPTNAIHPSIMEAGLEGLWTPRIVPRIGYCMYSCTLCGQVCPSRAIRRLSPEEKTGSGQHRPVKIGTAVINQSRCIVWAKGQQCLACEEVCPVSPKAVRFEEAVVVGSDGKPVVVKRPSVDPLSCVGCGRCEYICPVEGEAAIRVFSVGETRSKEEETLIV